MKPRTKFLIGGVLVIGTAGYLAASAIKDTGVYYLTPGELQAKTRSDPSFYETGVKVGARVVKGSIVRDPGGRQVAFKMTDKSAPPRPHYPVWCAGADARQIGEVVSGTQSPSLGIGIGLGYVPPEFALPGTSIDIEIRGKRSPAEIVKKPIYQK